MKQGTEAEHMFFVMVQTVCRGKFQTFSKAVKFHLFVFFVFTLFSILI